MRVLVACEMSGIVRDAFAARGHDAWSCDLLPSEKPGQHIQADIFQVLNNPLYGAWDMMIFHWPCTTLTNSGVRWLYGTGKKSKVRDETRWGDMEFSARCFRNLLDWPSIPKIVGENPIPHLYARRIMGKYSQRIQPWYFGEPQFKATCLWLRGVPPLQATNLLTPPAKGTPEHKEWSKVHRASPGPNRWKERSRTLQGIADAMAAQWG